VDLDDVPLTREVVLQDFGDVLFVLDDGDAALNRKLCKSDKSIIVSRLSWIERREPLIFRASGRPFPQNHCVARVTALLNLDGGGT
jgi:hypothetical protein